MKKIKLAIGRITAMINHFAVMASKKLKSKVRKTTTISSFVSLIIMLGCLVLLELLFNLSGGLFQIWRVVICFVLLELTGKFICIFIERNSYNKQGIDVLDLYKELKTFEHNLSITERNKVAELMVLQRNSKEHKLVKRENNRYICIAIILGFLFVLGII